MAKRQSPAGRVINNSSTATAYELYGNIFGFIDKRVYLSCSPINERDMLRILKVTLFKGKFRGIISIRTAVYRNGRKLSDWSRFGRSEVSGRISPFSKGDFERLSI